MGEPTPAQLAACDRAMDGLEAQADIWADEVDLVVIVKQIGAVSRGLSDRMPKEIRDGFINRQEANVDAIARQAYLEGFYRGGESRKDHDEPRIEALVKALRNCRDRLKMDLDEIQHLRRWLSDSEMAERADQDEIADEADKQAIAEATEALNLVLK